MPQLDEDAHLAHECCRHLLVLCKRGAKEAHDLDSNCGAAVLPFEHLTTRATGKGLR